MPITSSGIFAVIFGIAWVAIVLISVVVYRRRADADSSLPDEGSTDQDDEVYSSSRANWPMNCRLGKPENGFDPWSTPRKDEL